MRCSFSHWSEYISVSMMVLLWWRSAPISRMIVSNQSAAILLSRIFMRCLMSSDVMGWPQPRCSLPSWISRTEWRDLDGRSIYTIAATGGGTANDVITVSGYEDMASFSSALYVSKSFRCITSNNDQHASASSYVTMMFVFNSWYSNKVQLVHCTRHHHGIFSLAKWEHRLGQL